MNLFSVEPPHEPLQNPVTVSLLVSLLGAWLGAFCTGISLGYTSPAAESLAASTGEKAEMFHAMADCVWFRSLLPIGAMVGSGLAGFACQVMGRRFALLLSVLTSMLGYAVLFAASSPVLIYSGRLLTGVACGIASLTAPAYVAELTLPGHRGTAGGALYLAATVGILYSYVLGLFLRWQLLAMACFAAAVLVMAANHVSEESPRWLLLKGRKLEALQALLSIRGPHFRVENECVAIEQWFIPVQTPMWHVLLALHMHFLQQFTGISMVIFYAH
ncbi:solute carrier family 2, facilitated glucose transporter member 8-like, partial [Amblyomma americanum]